MVYPHIEYHGAYPDPLESETSATTRELDTRVSDGIIHHPYAYAA